MKYTLVLLVILTCSYESLADSFLKDFKTINRLISQEELDQLNPQKNIGPVSGQFFVPFFNTDSIKFCTDEKRPEDEKFRYQVIFVGEANLYSNISTENSAVMFNEGYVEMDKGFSKMAYNPDSYSKKFNEKYNTTIQDIDVKENFSKEVILNLSKRAYQNLAEREFGNLSDSTDDIYKKEYKWKYNKPFDPNSSLGMELVVETLIKASARSELSENELAKKFGEALSSLYTTEDQKYRVLNTFLSRLYVTYNESRNPYKNNDKNNPDHLKIPAGDMNFNQLIKATSRYSEFDAGVCNDIVEAGAMVAENMFPNKDVIIINSGSHFNLAITDGVNTRVLDGTVQTQMQNDLMLQQNSSATVLHLSKVVDGKMKNFALVDTQVGQVSESLFQTGKKLLKTSVDVNTIISGFNAYKKKSNGDSDYYAIKTGYAKLNNSHIVMVVAKLDAKRGISSSYIGVGASAQMFQSPNVYNKDSKNLIQLEAKAGSKIDFIHYQSPFVNFKLNSGLEISGAYSILAEDFFSWSAEWVNNLFLEVKDKSAQPGLIQLEAQSRSALGIKNWGEVTGLNSSFKGETIPGTISQLEFYLNQVYVGLHGEKPINEKLKLSADASYLGSPVGQMLKGAVGLNVTAPDGVEIMVFVGYEDNKLPGYETKNSLLFGTRGATVGGEIRTPSGVKMKTRFRGIGYDQTEGHLGIELPLDIKTKR